MPPPPEASTLPRPRFFWPGLLVALPLLLLAGLAAAGLRLRWQARLVEAQEEGQRTVERVAAGVERVMGDTPAQARLIRLYADPPVPPPAAHVSTEWRQMLEADDMARLKDLRDAKEPAWTEAGLPVATLAAWEVFSRDPSPENAKDLVEVATIRWPCAVSPVILGKAAELAKVKGPVPGVLAESLDVWELAEGLRTLVSRHPSQVDGDEWLVDGGCLWFFRRSKGETSIANPTSAFLKLLEPGAGNGIPAWMTVSLWKDGELIASEAYANPRVHRLGLAEYRAQVNVRAELTDPDRLYAPLRAEIGWASGLIGAATLSAGGGLWLSRRALRREQRLHALKSQFVASVSHELRAPIGSVRLMAEALAAGTVDGDVSRTFYRLLAQEGQRLSALIENVLDFARMESGRKAYQFEETDIAALLRDTIALLEPRAAPRRIRIQLELQPLPQVPEVDALAVQQAVMNLLDNALKFSPDQGLITVTLAEDPPGGWSIAIADEGPGIPPAEHRRIFERFHRLGNELRRETQGAGIGLSLVQHIAEGHGGRVTVKNREPCGSVFTLHFSGEGKGFRVQGSEPDR